MVFIKKNDTNQPRRHFVLAGKQLTSLPSCQLPTAHCQLIITNQLINPAVTSFWGNQRYKEGSLPGDGGYIETGFNFQPRGLHPLLYHDRKPPLLSGAHFMVRSFYSGNAVEDIIFFSDLNK